VVVDLLIQYKDTTRKPLYAPVSVMQTFHDHWEPLAEELQLQYIPLFGAFKAIDQDDVEQVIAELKLMKAHLESSANTFPTKVSEYMLQRLGPLIIHLEQAATEWESIASLVI
jgi:hypothetical protein